MTRFVDTNVLIYAISTDSEDAHKRRLARELLTATDLALSTQVLQEFYVQATRPAGSAGLSHGEAVTFAEALQRFPVQAITLNVVDAAFAIRERFRLSYWDSAILAGAKALGCEVVYSEDMNHGQDYDGLRVINPFVDSPRVIG